MTCSSPCLRLDGSASVAGQQARDVVEAADRRAEMVGGSRLRHWPSATSKLCGLGLSGHRIADHNNGGFSVVRAMLADRPKQRLDEVAVSAAADN
jgi:hypothetical protein